METMMVVDVTTKDNIIMSHYQQDDEAPLPASSTTTTTTTTTTVNRQAHPVMLPPSDPSLIEYIIDGDNNNHDNHNHNHNHNHTRNIIRSVPAKMNYVSKDTTQVHVRRDLTGDDHGTEFNEGAQGWIPTDVSILNGRLLLHDKKLCLETHGFELQTKPLVSSSSALDFLDSTQVLDTYYPSCEKLLMEYFQNESNNNDNNENDKKPTPKLAVVKAFDHNIRIRQGQSTTLKGSTNNNNDDDGTSAKTQPPLGMVHGDYTMDSGPRRIHDLGQPPKANDVWKERLGGDGEAVLDPQLVQDALEGKRRFAIINVWRNIDTEFSVEEYPLACVDSTTVNPSEELRRLYIHYADRVGENYFVTPSPLHQWYYFPHMTHSEILLIKQWDSHGDMAATEAARQTSAAASDSHPSHPLPRDHHNKEHRSTFSIHSAFVDPTSATITNQEGNIVPPKPRKSIEVRCALIWEREEEDVPV